jgi:hypothetical protein
MTRILIDANLPAKLRQLTEPAELCNDSGQVLGRYFPTPDLSQYEPWEPAFDEEELRKQEQSDEWYTTEQVLARLKSLEGK